MKPLILSIILAFTITHATAQSLTVRPMPNGTTVCSPAPAGGSAGIGPALVVLGVLWLINGYLKSKDDNQKEEKEQ
jgi:hypothetical protein